MHCATSGTAAVAAAAAQTRGAPPARFAFVAFFGAFLGAFLGAFFDAFLDAFLGTFVASASVLAVALNLLLGFLWACQAASPPALATPQYAAIGLPGEPVAPTSFNGAQEIRNS